jgi:hypothetical protein
MSKVVCRAQHGCPRADRRILFGLPPRHRPYPGRPGTAAGAGQAELHGNRPRSRTTWATPGDRVGLERMQSSLRHPRALRARPRRAAWCGLRQWNCHPSPWVRAEFVLRCATRVPHRTDKPGVQRTTTVTRPPPMSCRLKRLQHERIPRICLISMRSRSSRPPAWRFKPRPETRSPGCRRDSRARRGGAGRWPPC